MSGLGSGPNGELTFMDIISLISYQIGVENLHMNVTQEDMAHVAADIDEKMARAIEDIHRHLAVQDSKLNIIMEVLKNEENRKDDL